MDFLFPIVSVTPTRILDPKSSSAPLSLLVALLSPPSSAGERGAPFSGFEVLTISLCERAS